MFICRKDAPEDAKYLFDMPGNLGISYGPCEICGVTTECVDWHGCLDSSANSDDLPPAGDIDRYGKQEQDGY